MKTTLESGQLTCLEFTEADHKTAEAIANKLGYADNFAYTSTSQFPGLFCLAHSPNDPDRVKNPKLATKSGAIIKTAELGFLFVQTPEELGVEL